MVFFTCNVCGESLKKAQVDKHLHKCRECHSLSCIDCGKDFWGEDYRNHNKCISEDQKYGGRDFQVKVNKGDVKQLQWIQRIQEAMKLSDIDPKLYQILDQVSSYENVPRKRGKFQNWIMNSLKIHNPALIQQVWEILFTANSGNNTQSKETLSECSPESQTNPEVASEEISEQNGHDTCENGMKKKRKRHTEETHQHTEEKKKKKKHKKSKQEEIDESLNTEGEEPVDQEVESESNAKGKFNWKGTIKAVLRDAPDEELAVKKLRKKVLAQYYSFTGNSNYRSEEEVLALFNKKIHNNPKFKILKEKVRLVK